MAAVNRNSKQIAVALTDTAWSRRAQERRIELRRMRAFATGLLVLMLVIFVAARIFEARLPALAYVRACAEAAMVGACADWFAVVALFRHPFGLPIPHTAILPRNKARVGESLGAFICNNFLAPEVVSQRLAGLHAAARAARWLSDPANAGFIARRSAGLLPPMLEALQDEHVRTFMRGILHRGVASVEAAPLAARVLSVLVAHGHHQALFDRAIATAETFLTRHEPLIRAKVSTRSWKWLPRWVDEKVADRVMTGLMETVHELRAPDHPWREEFQVAVDGFILRLAADPLFRARGEAIKAEVLDSPVVEDYLDSLWTEIKRRLIADTAADDGVLRQGLEQALLVLGHRLQDDPRMQAVLDRWVRRAAERYIIPNRGEIGAFIAGVVARWDSATLVAKLELQVGKDLQYIRINGTLVGGLVGLVIFALSTWLG